MNCGKPAQNADAHLGEMLDRDRPKESVSACVLKGRDFRTFAYLLEELMTFCRKKKN
ncbi:MAG: hypothetical protein LDL41_11985 [Coleofasciculus sp. S288]|nr:hypothetical protein [Coleofasciculus sp. S288]